MFVFLKKITKIFFLKKFNYGVGRGTEGTLGRETGKVEWKDNVGYILDRCRSTPRQYQNKFQAGDLIRWNPRENPQSFRSTVFINDLF